SGPAPATGEPPASPAPQAAPTPPAGAGPQSPEAWSSFSSSHDDAPVALPGRRGPSVRALLLGAGALAAVALVAGLVALWVLRSGPDLRARVVQTDRGEALQVEVPEAPQGTRVRFDGREAELEAGRVRFPLSADDLSVGDNELSLDVVSPDGDVTEAALTLTLDYRVYTELDGLDDDPPALSVVVHAPPGAEATVDGQAVDLGSDGRGRRRVAMEEHAPAEGPDAAYEHASEYRIALPDGEPAAGTVRARIPYTTLQLDRPGREVLTDAEAVEIAGAVHSAARVTVDGDPVEVTDGRFVLRYPLPETGVHEVAVVAHQPRRMPRRRTIRIERVADLNAAAEGFPADQDVTYAKLVQNPAIYRGRKVDMTGRIYNVEVGGGKSVLQMLVRRCPAGERCPLWVTYDAATDLTVQSWARVLGEVTGEQQFRAESGRVMSVPRVHAKLVLPVKE
ncbi:MAG: hypothetical protein ACODAU_12605, partial [Myxococcota bacterium]